MTEAAFEGLGGAVGRVPAPVRKAVNRALRTYATATADLRARPDFILIGSKRGGTTTLYHALVRHPDVAPLFPRVANIKSPHYLDLEHARGERWYRSHFPYRRPPGVAQPKAGDAAPYLLYHPLGPARTYAAAPETRLVAVLRDPIERAFSHYWDRVKNGVETLSFAEALAAEPERLAGEEAALLADPDTPRPAHEHFSYLDRGRYAAQLRRWLEVFPAEQLLVIRSEDLYRDPAAVFERVLVHLRLGAYMPPEFGRHHQQKDKPGVPAELRAQYAPTLAAANRELAELLGTPLWWDESGPVALDELQVVVPPRR